MPAVSYDRFLDAVRSSGLLAADHLDAQLRRCAAEGPAEDARELAARFVRDGLLTPFQADSLLQGKWRNFIIAGKYKVLGVLGAGGMGQVYLAEHTLMRRRSALKVLPKKLTADPAAVERFVREAQAVAALDHQNIVRAYDIDRDDDMFFLVMEHVDGVSLQELVARRGPVAPAAAANYVAQAARGLQHAHEAGWVHRDVKPANLLLDRNGVVKVLDLGLARLLGDEGGHITGRLGEDNVLGTADYVAPEQASDSHAADIRSDVYSLGATLYFLLAGRPPFPDGTVAQKLLWHQTTAPPPLHELRPGVPARLTDVMNRMLAKDPADRHAVPAAVAEALAPWAGGLPGDPGSFVTFPPPDDLRPGGSSGAPSSAMSSWSPRGGRSSSKSSGTGRSGGSTAVPAAAPTAAGETAAANEIDTKPAKRTRPATPPPLPVRRRRRWPVVAGVAGAVGLATVVAVALWPRSPTSIPPAETAAPTPVAATKPEPAGEVRRFVGHAKPIENVAFTPDGRRLVTVSQDGTARVWDVATGAEVKRLTGHAGAVRGLALFADGKRAVTTGFDGTVRLWDLDSGRELGRFADHAGEVWCVAVDPAGKRLLTAGTDKVVRLWDVDSRKVLRRLTGHEDLVTGVVFLPDGRKVVSTSQDKTVRVWNLQNGKNVRWLTLQHMVYRLALAPDGRRILFGCHKSLRRWDPEMGGQAYVMHVTTPEAVEGGVGLPDGRMVIAVLDGTIRVWDVDRDQEVHRFPGNGQAMLALAVAPDGNHFASGGRDGTARLWRLP